MSKPDSLDELFQRPLELADDDALSARIMLEVALLERRRKVLLAVSGVAGVGIALSIVLWANVLPMLALSFEKVGLEFIRFVGWDAPVPVSVGLAALAAASLVAMGVAAVRVTREA